jgi:drug/metabolite transporter (DMT)-like permease
MLTQSFEKGIGFTLLSAFCLSLFGLFTKLEVEIDTMPLFLTLRFFVPLVLMLPLLHSLRELKTLFPVKHLASQLLRAVTVVIGQYALFYYLTQGTLFDATMLVSIGPAMIPILSKILYRHHIGMITGISVAIGFIGVACILKPTSGIFDPLSIYGLIAGLGAGLSQVLYGASVERESNTQNLFYLYFFTTILSIPLLFAGTKISDTDVVTMITKFFMHPFYALLFLLMISVTTIGNQYFRGLAYQLAKPPALAPFLYSTVLFSAFFDWLIFHHIPTGISIAGGALVIFSAFLRWSVGRKKRMF